MRRRATRIGVVVALVAGAMLGASPVVVAHSSLIGSTPEDGAVLADAPDEVVLQFDEDVQPDFSQVAVLDAEENHYEDGDPVSDGQTVTQAVTELPAGDYSISYRVGSADGHPVTGVVAFMVEQPEGDGAADEPAGTDATERAPSGDGSEDDATANDDATDAATVETSAEDEDGTPMATVVATMAAIALVGAAGVLLMRRRPGTSGDESPPGEQ